MENVLVWKCLSLKWKCVFKLEAHRYLDSRVMGFFILFLLYEKRVTVNPAGSLRYKFYILR